jgi:phosphatidate cytidylyltransferase
LEFGLARKGFRVLRYRLITAFVLIVVMSSLLWLDYHYPLRGVAGAWLIAPILFFSIGTASDMGRLIASAWPVRKSEIALAVLFVVSLSIIPIVYPAVMDRAYPANCPIGKLGWIGMGIFCWSFVSGIIALRRFSQDASRTLEVWALSTLAAAYLGGGFAFWITVRLFADAQWSLLALLGLIIIIKMSDSAAYFVGKSIGKTKLCPTISPKKTWEGAIGGFAIAILVSVFYFGWLMPWMFDGPMQLKHWIGSAVLGLAVAVAGLFGDLIESIVKRCVNAKDSGSTLPGLGGFWDLTDSIIPTGFVGYCCFVADLVWVQHPG